MSSSKEKILTYTQLHLLYFLYSWVLVGIKLASFYPVLSIQYLLYMACAVCLLGVYAVFWQRIIKRIDLSIAYPQKGVVVFWVMLWSWLIWGDSITIFNLIGAVVIITGVALMVNENE